MSSDRKTTTIVGGLYVVSMIAGILSIAPAIDSADYLIEASANANQIFVNAFFQLIMTAIYVFIAVMLYPILKKQNESLALGFLSFRIIASVFVIVGVLSLMLLLTLSREYVKFGAPDALFFQTLGKLLQTCRDLANHAGMIISLSISSTIMYCISYKTKIIPRWLSVWGLLGTTSAICASLLVMIGLIKVISPSYLSLTSLLGLQELVFAFWLIFKGFNYRFIESEK